VEVILGGVARDEENATAFAAYFCNFLISERDHVDKKSICNICEAKCHARGS
jgi:hypothetical protein